MANQNGCPSPGGDSGVPVTDGTDEWQNAGILSAALNATEEMVLVKDESLVVRYVNDAFCCVLGRSRDELIGRTEADLFPWHIVESLECDDRAVFDAGRTVDRQVLLPTTDRLIWTTLRKTPLTIQGRRAGVLTVMRDISGCLHAECRLRQSHALLDRFLAQLPYNVAYLDRSFKYLRVSAGYARLAGQPPEAFIGRAHFDLYPDPDIRSRFEEVLHTGRPYKETVRSFIVPMVSCGPSACWDLTVQPVRDGLGIVDGLIIGLVDATTREEAQAALRESETNYRLLAENQSALIVKVGPDNRLRYANPAYCHLFGKRAQDLIGRDFMPLVHEDDRATTEAAMARLKDPPHSVTLEQRVRTAAKGWRWVSWQDTAVLDDAGRIVGIVGVGRDITEQRHAEAALRRSEAEKALILGSLSDLVTYFDEPDLRITWTNAASARSLRLDIESMIGRCCYELWAERETPCPGCPVLRTFETASPFEGRQTTPDGRVWSVRAFPALDESNTLMGVVEVARDVSELALTQEKFEKAFIRNATLMAITDPATGRFIDVNTAFLEALQLDREAVVGRTTVELGLFPDQKSRDDLVADLVDTEPGVSRELCFKSPDGRTMVGEFRAERIRSGPREFLLTMITDVTRQRELMTELEHKATHDVLTGACNRLRADRVLDEEVRRAARVGPCPALIMIDIDRFKVVNDRFGHPVGDQVLQTLVTRLSARIRETDLLARWGGEEFLVILPGTDEDGAVRLAETLRTTMAETRIPEAGRVTISLGVAAHHPGESVADWVGRADAALYEAKRAGRNRVRKA